MGIANLDIALMLDGRSGRSLDPLPRIWSTRFQQIAYLSVGVCDGQRSLVVPYSRRAAVGSDANDTA